MVGPEVSDAPDRATLRTMRRREARRQRIETAFETETRESIADGSADLTT